MGENNPPLGMIIFLAPRPKHYFSCVQGFETALSSFLSKDRNTKEAAGKPSRASTFKCNNVSQRCGIYFITQPKCRCPSSSSAMQLQFHLACARYVSGCVSGLPALDFLRYPMQWGHSPWRSTNYWYYNTNNNNTNTIKEDNNTHREALSETTHWIKQP